MTPTRRPPAPISTSASPRRAARAATLENAGYATGLVGKWHLGFKPSSIRIATASITSGVIWPATSIGTPTFAATAEPDLWENATAARYDGYLDHELTNRAVAFVSEHANGPFFLEVAYGAPHWPFQSPHRPSTAARRNGSMLQQPADADPPSRKDYAEIVEDLDAGVGRSSRRSRRAASPRRRSSCSSATTAASGSRATRRSFTARTRCGRAAFECRLSSAGRPDAGRADAVAGWHHHGFLGDLRRACGRFDDGEPTEGIDLLPILRGAAPPVERTLFWRVGPAPGQPRAARSGDWKLVLDGSKQLLFDVSRIRESGTISRRSIRIVCAS